MIDLLTPAVGRRYTNSLVSVAVLSSGVVLFEPAIADFLFVAAGVLGLVTRSIRINGTAMVFGLLYLAGGWLAWVLNSEYREFDSVFVGRYLFIEAYLALMAATVYFLSKQEPGRSLKILRYYVIGAALVSILILLLHFGPQPGWIYRDTGAFRIKGTFKDPNVLGPYLVYPTAALLVGGFRVDRTLYRVLLAIPCLVLLLLTYSRAGYVALILSVFLFWAATSLRSKTSISRVVSVGIVVIALAAVVYSSDFFSREGLVDDRLSSRLAVQAYDDDRFTNVEVAGKLALEQPLGIGPGAFTLISHNNPHNTPVAKALDGGILASLILMSFLIGPLRRTFQSYLKSDNREALLVGLVLLAHVVVSQVVYAHHWRHMILLAALAWAYDPTCESDGSRGDVGVEIDLGREPALVSVAPYEPPAVGSDS